MNSDTLSTNTTPCITSLLVSTRPTQGTTTLPYHTVTKNLHTYTHTLSYIYITVSPHDLLFTSLNPPCSLLQYIIIRKLLHTLHIHHPLLTIFKCNPSQLTPTYLLYYLFPFLLLSQYLDTSLIIPFIIVNTHNVT